MTFLDIIKAAIPDADEALAEYIIWERTPYPMKPLSARDIYRAASRYRRAEYQNLRLCEFCDRPAAYGRDECRKCRLALRRCRAVRG